MDDHWRVLEEWLAANDETVGDVLRPPAPDEQIASLETTTGVDLPESFVSFLQVHDGQTPDSRPVLRRFRLFTVESIEREWRRMFDLLEDGTFEGRMAEFDGPVEKPDAEIRDVWWSERWIPFAGDVSGNYLCVDLDPSPAGDRGQVISVWHDTPARGLRASSFAAWFEDVATALADGAYVYSTETHSMMADRAELDVVSAKRIENPAVEDIRRVCEHHWERSDGDEETATGNWFVEVVFEWQGEIGPTVQYKRGTLNLAALGEEDYHERARAVLEDEQLPIVDEGDVFLTVSDPSLDASRVPGVIERVLADVYDRAIADVVEVRERNLG